MLRFAHGQMKETELEKDHVSFHKWRDRCFSIDYDNRNRA